MDDNKIIELYWKREETAIKETSQKYGGLCTHIAKNILLNHEDSEECVNDTYLLSGMRFQTKDRIYFLLSSAGLQEIWH